MPTPQFSATRGWSSELTGEDQLREQNAQRQMQANDQMTRMMMQQAAQAQNAAALAAQERMFNTSRQDQGMMFNRQFDADAARTLAQERMHKEGLGFQKEMFNLQDTAANNRFTKQQELDDQRALRSRGWQKEDYGMYNPMAAMQSEAIARIRSGAGTVNDYKVTNIPMPDDMAEQSTMGDIERRQRIEETIAKKRGLMTPTQQAGMQQELTNKEMSRTKQMNALTDVGGDPQINAQIEAVHGPALQREFKRAAESKNPEAVMNAAANARSTLMQAGMPRQVVEEVISKWSKAYRPGLMADLNPFRKWDWGGDTRDVMDTMILESLQGN